MKHRILILLLFFAAPAAVFAQTLYTVGVTFCASPPSHNPGTSGAKYAIDTTTWDLYVRSYGTTWTLIGNNIPQDISGCSAPAYTPTKFQSKVVINACSPAEMYIWDGSAWNQVGGAAGLSGTGLANRLAIWNGASAAGYESTFLADTVNNRLMIGAQTAPTAKLQLAGTLGGDPAIKISNPTITIPAVSSQIYNLISIDAYPSATANTQTINGLNILHNVSYGAFTPWLPGSAINISAQNVPCFRGASGNPTSTTIAGQYSIFEFTQSGANNSSTGFTFRKQSNAYGQFIQLRNARPSAGTANIIHILDDNLTLNNQNELIRVSDAIVGTNNYIYQRYNNGVLFSDNIGSFYFQPFHFSDATAGLQLYGRSASLGIAHGTAPSAKFEIRGTGATSSTASLDVANSNDSTILLVRNDRRVGINTATPDCELDVTGTGGIAFPSGTTAQRLAVDNQIRTDTDVDGVEVRYRGDWYRLTSDVTPSVSAGAGLGSGGSVSCVGNDLGGTITFTTGSTAVSGDLFTATFAGAFSSGNVITVTFSARNAAAAAETAKIYVSAESTTAFTLTSWTALTDETEYKINYKISQ